MLRSLFGLVLGDMHSWKCAIQTTFSVPCRNCLVLLILGRSAPPCLVPVERGLLPQQLKEMLELLLQCKLIGRLEIECSMDVNSIEAWGEFCCHWVYTRDKTCSGHLWFGIKDGVILILVNGNDICLQRPDQLMLCYLCTHAYHHHP